MERLVLNHLTSFVYFDNLKIRKGVTMNNKTLYRPTMLNLNVKDVEKCEQVKSKLDITFIDIFRTGLNTILTEINEEA